ncbi:hypothetical protein [uncultured Tateyamaria sp.]|uniref:hypothetical protein n=1 Tax=uncultured Tateyamaria sp. TaxID=455651 RepID=UPI002603E838|nr:hypothetical protein [uncultured Tateyamaria sp.]
MIRAAALLTLLASPAAATPTPIAEILCAPTKQMQQKLERQFRSARTASGMRSPDQMMEVWTDKRGDWAMVVRYASGTSCIVAMGEHWEETENPT